MIGAAGKLRAIRCVFAAACRCAPAQKARRAESGCWRTGSRFASAMPGYSLPARQARRAACLYWSTRNRQPQAAPAWLDAAQTLTNQHQEVFPGLGLINNAQCQHTAAVLGLTNHGPHEHAVADLGSDPNSARDLSTRHKRIPELGSDPNSAGHGPVASIQHQRTTGFGRSPNSAGINPRAIQ